MTLLSDSALELLTAALNSEKGIKVRVVDPGHSIVTPTLRAKQIFYRFRGEYPDFKVIQIRISPDDPENELWLMKVLPGEKRPKPDSDETSFAPDGTIDVDL